MRKVEPLPSSLSTEIVPPISSTRRLEMARPSPVPPNRRVVEASTWLNDVNSLSIRSGGMPMPVSRTTELEPVGARPGRLSAGEDDDLARLGELDGVREQVQQHLAQARRVAEDAGAARPRRSRHPSSIPFSQARGRDDVQRSLHALAQAERLAFEVELAGLDLRVVEDVVDHVQQRVAARPDDLRELALLARQLRAEQEIGHPDHRVHRRSDLVAHRGQERTLRLRRGLGLLAGALVAR